MMTSDQSCGRIHAWCHAAATPGSDNRGGAGSGRRTVTGPPARRSTASSSPSAARPPLRSWILSWKSLGFDGAVVKAANSRYVPSTVTEEWTVVTKLSSL